jgi:toxin FitB
MNPVAMDTSAAIPYLVRSHPAHIATRRQMAGRAAVLTAHSLAETYAVLTRLPGDARLLPLDAARIIAAAFGEPISPEPDTTNRLPEILAGLGIAGGAVYDALVALAAAAGGATLVTRDARAIATYSAVGAMTEIVAG